MYQIHLRAQASKLATLASEWQAYRMYRRTARARRKALGSSTALTGLARIATLRVSPDASTDMVTRYASRDPQNW
jgi:hypothetical protein